ncbi:MAG: DUF4097 family beta strand repeat-containing protein [Eubacteriales bacterium]|nr:DUF4097 family beta strand repeat-containing protein [Eubacteriales bacterium]
MNRKKGILLLAIILATSFIMTGCMWSANPLSLRNWSFNPFRFLTSRTHIVNETETFSIDGINDLVVDVLVKELRIVETNDSKATVDLKGSINANFSPELIVEKSGKGITIRSHKRNLTSTNIYKNELIMTVSIPAGYSQNLKGSTVSGVINMNGFALNNLELSNVSGAINLDKSVSKDTKMSTVSGALTANHIKSDRFDITTVSGKISLGNIMSDAISAKSVSGAIDVFGGMNSLTAKTTSGKVTANIEDLNGNIDITTISGAVELDIPEDSDYRLNFSTVTGGFDPGSGLVIEQIKNNDVTAVKGSGTYSVKISTTSGKLTIN